MQTQEGGELSPSRWRSPPEWLALVLPLLVTSILLAAEWLVTRQAEGARAYPALGKTFTDAAKYSIQMSTDLAKFFIGLSMALVGGLAYYIQSTPKEFAEHTPQSRVLVVACLLAVVVSVFFGHLWIAELRNQISMGYYDPTGVSLAWCERLQYGSFLFGLAYFGLLAWDRETHRRQSAAP